MPNFFVDKQTWNWSHNINVDVLEEPKMDYEGDVNQIPDLNLEFDEDKHGAVARPVASTPQAGWGAPQQKHRDGMHTNIEINMLQETKNFMIKNL